MMREIEKHSTGVPAPGYTQQVQMKPDEKIRKFISYEKQKEIFK